MNKFSTANLLLVSSLLLTGCGDREKDRIEMDKELDFYCPNDSQITYEAWSEYGLMKVCRSTESGEIDGSKFAAQDGRLRSKAIYSGGLRKGGWTGYDNDGKAMPVDGGYKFPVQAGEIDATPRSTL